MFYDNIGTFFAHHFTEWTADEITFVT